MMLPRFFRLTLKKSSHTRPWFEHSQCLEGVELVCFDLGRTLFFFFSILFCQLRVTVKFSVYHSVTKPNKTWTSSEQRRPSTSTTLPPTRSNFLFVMTTNKRIHLAQVYNAAHFPPSEERKKKTKQYSRVIKAYSFRKTANLWTLYLIHLSLWETNLFLPQVRVGVEQKAAAFWTQLNGIRRGTAVGQGLVSFAGSFTCRNHGISSATSIRACTGRSREEWTDLNCDRLLTGRD